MKPPERLLFVVLTCPVGTYFADGWTVFAEGGEPRAMHYLLFYDVGEDYLARRASFRAAHLQKAWQAHDRGELVLAGALADPVDGAVLLFKGESREVAEAFARTDPYVTNGLVTRWRVREWTTVVGQDAAMPRKP